MTQRLEAAALPSESATTALADLAIPLSARARVRLIGEIVAAYVQARRELRRAPIGSVVAALRSRSVIEAPRPQGRRTFDEARRLGRIVIRVLRLLPGDTRCLTRSLVLTQLLARRGIPAKLVIGARAAPDFRAHAWVEYDGHPVLPPGDGSYGRLIEL
jgi:hypothetical protein